MPKNLKTDIIIVGAGLIGTSFALSMKDSGHSIYILETHLPTHFTQDHQKSRPLSLSFGSYRILKELKIWETLKEFASPILSVHVSEQGRFGYTHFSAQEEKVPALGYVVPFSKLYESLYLKVSNQPNVKFLSIQSIEKIQCDDNNAYLEIQTIDGFKTLKANLLIAADGTDSTCRHLLNMGCYQTDYQDKALVYQINLSESHDFTAYERFTKYGVLAILPLFEKNKVQLVWSVTERIYKKITEWNEAQILLFLQTAFDGRLLINSIKKLAQFSLKTMIADQQIGAGCVLLGNSAHTLYPIAAQGFNLGLHDIAVLSNILSQHQNIGHISVLKQYETAVLQHQQAIYDFTYKTHSLFEFAFIGSLRGLGLMSLNLLSTLKGVCAKRAMGVKRC